MSILQSVIEWIATCPYINKDADLHVDEISADGINYSIEQVPGTRTLKEDVLGNKLRLFTFLLVSREYSFDDKMRMTNAEFYENFANWLERSTEERTLPVLELGKTPESIYAENWGYFFAREENQDTGVYQITCKFEYWEDN